MHSLTSAMCIINGDSNACYGKRDWEQSILPVPVKSISAYIENIWSHLNCQIDYLKPVSQQGNI